MIKGVWQGLFIELLMFFTGLNDDLSSGFEAYIDIPLMSGRPRNRLVGMNL